LPEVSFATSTEPAEPLFEEWAEVVVDPESVDGCVPFPLGSVPVEVPTWPLAGVDPLVDDDPCVPSEPPSCWSNCASSCPALWRFAPEPSSPAAASAICRWTSVRSWLVLAGLVDVVELDEVLLAPLSPSSNEPALWPGDPSSSSQPLAPLPGTWARSVPGPFRAHVTVLPFTLTWT
jgi:hypothetical protein